MRHAIGIVLLLIGLIVMPAQAQDSTIAELVIQSANAPEPQFTFLQTAIQATGLTQFFGNSDSQLTVFAPTDDAFTDLPAGVLDLILADQTLLTRVLTYHVTQGALTSDTLNPSVIISEERTTPDATPLGTPLTIDIMDDGMLIINEAGFVQFDILASNGVVHAIDTLLLPPDIADALVDATAGTRIRFAHFSPDAGAVDIFINGELTRIQNLAFPEVTDWMPRSAELVTIAIAPAGSSITETVIGPIEVNLPISGWTTIAVVGSATTGTLTASVLPEDHTITPNGSGRIGIFNAIEDGPAIDVRSDATFFVAQLGYPGAFGNNDGFFEVGVIEETYNLNINATGTGTTLISLPNTRLPANTYTFIAAVGTPDNPQAIVIDTRLSPQALATELGGNSIAGIVLASATSEPPQFTLLLSALQASEESWNLLANPFEQVTVFAPTDTAFVDVIRQLEMTPADVLAMTELLDATLGYHVVRGAFPAETLTAFDGIPLTTLQGETISITLTEEGVLLNDTVRVVQTDVFADNGVIHVIDSVLVPQAVVQTLGQ